MEKIENFLNFLNQKEFNLIFIKNFLNFNINLLAYKTFSLRSINSEWLNIVLKFLMDTNFQLNQVFIDELILNSRKKEEFIVMLQNQKMIRRLEMSFKYCYYDENFKYFMRGINNIIENQRILTDLIILDLKELKYLNINSLLKKRFKTLHFENIILEEEEIQAIARYKSEHSLQDFRLMNCKLLNEHIQSITENLKDQKNVRQLSFSYNDFQLEGLSAAFYNIFNNCKTLKDLRLFDCTHFRDTHNSCDLAISKKFVFVQTISKLENLNLSFNKLSNELGVEVLKIVANCCSSIKNLYLSNCFADLFDELFSEIEKLLTRNKEIKVINLSNNNIGGKNGTILLQKISSQCLQVTTLVFANCQLDSSIENSLKQIFKNLKYLEYVDLSSNSFNGNFLNNVFNDRSRPCSSLERFFIESCEIQMNLGDEFLNFLGGYCSLTSLSLSNNFLGPIVSGEILKIFTCAGLNIHFIALRSCGLDFTVENTIINFFRKNPQLNIIDFSNNYFGPSVGVNIFKEIGENCCELEEVFFNNCGLSGKILGELNILLVKNPNLSKLSLRENLLQPEKHENFFKIISEHCDQLTALDISNCYIYIKDINIVKFIQKNNKLEHIQLGGNSINNGEVLLEQISKSSLHLKTFGCHDFFQNQTIENNYFLHQIIKNAYSLEALSIGYNDFGVDISKKILEALDNDYQKKLTQIFLPNCSIGEDLEKDLIKAIKAKTNLQTLGLSDNPIGSNLCRKLLVILGSNFSNLKSLYFNNCKLKNEIKNEFIDLVKKNKDLEDINLSDNNLGSSFGQHLLKILSENNCKVVSIYLSNCNFDSETSKFIPDFLVKNPKIESFYYCNNPILHKHVAARIFESFGKYNALLTKLSLMDCGLTGGIKDQFFEMLKKCKKIQYIDISENNLGQEFGEQFFSILADYSKNIRSLNIFNCGFDKKTNVKGLEKLLKRLKLFNLGKNQLGSENCESLLNFLPNESVQLNLLKWMNVNLDEQNINCLESFIKNQHFLSAFTIENSRNVDRKFVKRIFKALADSCCKLKVFHVFNLDLSHLEPSIMKDLIRKNNDFVNLTFSNNSLSADLSKDLFEQLSIYCSKIEYLQFDNCNLGEEIAGNLAKVIKNNLNLKRIDLSKNHFGTNSGKKIFSVMAEYCRKIECLKFISCNLTTSIEFHLIELLRENKSLRIIYLADNCLGVNIGRKMFSILSAMFENFMELDVKNCGFDNSTSKDIQTFIEKNDNLILLNLDEHLISKEIFICIEKYCRNLRYLSYWNPLQDIVIEESFFEIVKANQRLTMLELTEKFLKPEMMYELFINLVENCTPISFLTIKNQKVNEKGSLGISKLLSKNNVLSINFENLFFGFNNLKGVLKTILTNSLHLNQFILSNCHVNDELGKYLVGIIQRNNYLNWIDFSKNKLENELGIQLFTTMAESCLNLIHLDFCSCCLSSIIVDRLKNVLERNPRLEFINLSYNKLEGNETKDLIATLSNCKHLKSICFEGCDLNQGIEHELICTIQNLKHLKRVIFSENFLGRGIGQRLFKSMVDNKLSMQVLAFDDCGFGDEIKNDVLDIINQSPDLQTFAFSQNFLSPSTENSFLKKLSTICTNLKELSCFKYKMINCTENLITLIERNPYLTMLDLRENIGSLDDAKKILSALSENCIEIRGLGMKNCSLDGSAIYNIKEFLMRNPRLKRLDLSQNPLGSEAVKIIFETLYENSNLKMISLGNCCCNSEIDESLAKYLSKNTDLEDFRFYDNPIGSSAGNKIFQALSQNSENLEKLLFRNCSLNETVIESLSTIFEKAYGLKSIVFDNNIFSPEKGYKLFESLAKVCTNLKQISFENCQLGDTIGEHVINIARRNQYLELINFRKNPLISPFVSSLFKILGQYSISLKYFSFGECNLNISDGETLEKIINNNVNIFYLDFNRNQLDSISGNIFNAMKKNCTNLTGLCFNRCGLNDDVGDYLEEIILKNPRLDTLDLADNSFGHETEVRMLQGLAKNCRRLEKLNLQNLKLNDSEKESFNKILQNNPFMEELYLPKLNSINVENVFEKLCHFCPKLKIIQAMNCLFNSDIETSLSRFFYERPEIRLDMVARFLNCSPKIILENLIKSCAKTYGDQLVVRILNCHFFDELEDAYLTFSKEKNRISLENTKLKEIDVKHFFFFLLQTGKILNHFSIYNTLFSEKTEEIILQYFNKIKKIVNLEIHDKNFSDNFKNDLFDKVLKNFEKINRFLIRFLSFTERCSEKKFKTLVENSHIVEFILGVSTPLNSSFNHLYQLIRNNNGCIKRLGLSFLKINSTEDICFIYTEFKETAQIENDNQLTIYRIVANSCKNVISLVFENCNSLNNSLKSTTFKICAENNVMTVLTLKDTSFDEKTMQHFLKSFILQCKNVQSLIFKQCNFDETGADFLNAMLRNFPLTSLELALGFTKKNLSEQIVKSISENCQYLTNLYLSSSKSLEIGDNCREHMINVLINNRNLRAIDLMGYLIGNNTLRKICEILKENQRNCTSLQFSYCALDFTSLKFLRSIISSNSALVFLGLSNNFLGESYGAELCDILGKNCCQLRGLFIENCGLNDKSFMHLIEITRTNKNLMYLDISNNNFGN